jgi:undecaprenyl-phosphate 4-deoxy-4-formamido-L-arabinose transferase
MNDLSIVIPVYNSEGSVGEVVRRLLALLPSIAEHYEIILVNDGSRDNSWQVIAPLAAQNPDTVRGFNMMRNYGQHNALLAGIRQARYPITITMDDDLQHPPEEIPLLLAKLDEGYDVVYGTPKELPHSWWRNLTSRFTKRALAYAMGIKNIRDISAFRALRTELRQASASYQSPTLLLDVLLSWGTTKFASVPVNHMPRTIGKSNYNFIKLFNQTMLILTGFSTAPLRAASLMGFAFQIFGVLVLIYVLGRYALEGSVPGFPFLASVITIFSGAQLFALGIIGEYLARIFNRSMERPTYVIKESTRGQS